jgi:hypothetical protein
VVGGQGQSRRTHLQLGMLQLALYRRYHRLKLLEALACGGGLCQGQKVDPAVSDPATTSLAQPSARVEHSPASRSIASCLRSSTRPLNAASTAANEAP